MLMMNLFHTASVVHQQSLTPAAPYSKYISALIFCACAVIISRNAQQNKRAAEAAPLSMI